MLQGKSSNWVKLTFLNKEWFNRFDRDSAITSTKIQRKKVSHLSFTVLSVI